VHWAKRALLCTFGEFELADIDRKETLHIKFNTATMYLKLYDDFFCGLTCFALARKGKHVRYYKRQAKFCKKKLKVIAKQGCVNCIPLLALLSAEERALRDRTGDGSLYMEAIQMSGRSGFKLLKAIACERAGEYFLECGIMESGREFLQQALDEFHDCGAYAKQSQMRRKYDGLVKLSEPLKRPYRTSQKLRAHKLKKWQQDV
jgi:hypothetical protein